MKTLFPLCCVLGLLGASAHAAAPPAAGDYPSRPVRVVVPWVAGGGTDILARILAPRLGATLGQQVVIENRPGGTASSAATSPRARHPTATRW